MNVYIYISTGDDEAWWSSIEIASNKAANKKKTLVFGEEERFYRENVFNTGA
jgi:hypothetical protein